MQYGSILYIKLEKVHIKDELNHIYGGQGQTFLGVWLVLKLQGAFHEYCLNYILWRSGVIKCKYERTILLIFAPQVYANL